MGFERDSNQLFSKHVVYFYEELKKVYFCNEKKEKKKKKKKETKIKLFELN